MANIDILEEGKKLFDVEIQAMEIVKNALDDRFVEIVKLICDCTGKVVITGMGKPGHIGTKIAATMSSLGTPSFFLHPAEAQHGDLGMLRDNDVVIAISFSGESEEVTGVIITSTEKASVRMPKSTKAFLTSCCIFSLTKEQAARRSLSLI